MVRLFTVLTWFLGKVRNSMKTGFSLAGYELRRTTGGPRPSTWLMVLAVTAVTVLGGLSGCQFVLLGGTQGAPAPGTDSTAGQPEPGAMIQEGMASWYGGKFHGRQTASGEVFDKWKLTAAHRTLPMGSRIVVEHVETGRRVRVKVNDRGPFVDDRILDLSRGAAARLGMLDEGVARVRLYGDAASRSTAGETGTFTVQVGSFRDRDNATRFMARVNRNFEDVHLVVSPREFHRVRVGFFASRSRAEALAKKLRDQGYDTWVVDRISSSN